MATAAMDSMVGEEDEFQYKALHSGAVLGLAFALIASSFTLLTSANTPQVILVSFLNAPALALCLWSFSRIRSESDRYTGIVIAALGIVLSFAALVGGAGYGVFTYINEVPDGYTRTSFAAMKPDEIQDRGGITVPPEVLALEGKKVFIKGYIRPSSITVPNGNKEFLLVRDSNECCFGDLSKVKYYDQMLVTMMGDKRVDYSQRVFRMGGTLHIEPQNVAGPPGTVVFSLKADYAKN